MSQQNNSVQEQSQKVAQEKRTPPFLSVKERRESLEARYPTWPRDTLWQHFAKACEQFGEQPYFYLEEREISYQEVWQEAETYAKAFLALGVKRREHIAVLMANHHTFIPLMIAANKIGAVFIPINAMLTSDELHYILTQSDSDYLVVEEKVRQQNYGQIINKLLEEEVIGAIDEGVGGKVAKKAGLALKKVISLEDNFPEKRKSRFISWQEFIRGALTVDTHRLKERESLSCYPDEVAIILYTSGSTGSPKGVMLTSDMLLRCAYSTCLSRAIEEGRVTFAPLPFYHCFALVESILAMSFVGGSFISALGASPLQSLTLMEKHQANDYLCVPSMLLPLLNHPQVKEFDLSALYAMWCGAAAAPVSVWEKSAEILGLTEIITGYGQTEVSSSGVTTEIGIPLEMISAKVGRPKLGGVVGLPEFGGSTVEYKTIDRDTGETLLQGEVGELAVRGVTVTHGYYNKPQETAETIDKDGWLRTGDVGRIDEEGYLEVLGRSKEMFKVSGELVAPREVEIVISKHPLVHQVFVIGVPSTITTEIGAAFIELKENEQVRRGEIIAWCQERLAPFKVPRYVWFIRGDEWPMTGSGKVQKFKLQTLADAYLRSQK